jgi:hypothetical protein
MQREWWIPDGCSLSSQNVTLCFSAQSQPKLAQDQFQILIWDLKHDKFFHISKKKTPTICLVLQANQIVESHCKMKRSHTK